MNLSMRSEHAYKYMVAPQSSTPSTEAIPPFLQHPCSLLEAVGENWRELNKITFERQVVCLVSSNISSPTSKLKFPIISPFRTRT